MERSTTGIFYTTLQRRLHWLVLLMLIAQYLLQVPMRAAMAAIESQETLTLFQYLVATVHTGNGISIAAIMIWRWQLRRRAVPLAGGNLTPRREKLVRVHHVSLYVTVLGMMVTGALHYYVGIEAAGQWHEWGKWLLLVLVGVHIAGALSHGVRHGAHHEAPGVRSDTVLQRMMGRDSLR